MPPDAELEKFAIETFGKSYNQLDIHQKKVVGGKKGSSHAHGVKAPHIEQT